MGSNGGPNSAWNPLNEEQRKAPSVGCGSDEAERCLEPANGSLSSNAPGSDRPFSLTEETVAALTYVGRASTNFCCGLEPSLPKHVMGSEALFCPHMGLPLEGPLRAGFSLGAALP